MVSNENGEGATIHPAPFNQETVLDSAKKYIEQVSVIIMTLNCVFINKLDKFVIK